MMRPLGSFRLLAAAAFCASVPAAATPPSIVVEGGVVRLSHLAKTEDAEIGSLVVARLPRNAGQIEWSEQARLRLVKNRAPGMALQLRHRGPVQVVMADASDRNARRGACYMATADIPAGRHIVDGDVARTPCTADAPAIGLGYDRGLGAPIASSAIDAGGYLGAIMPLATEPAVAGQELTLRIMDGPIIIERDVVAIQSGRPGSKVFVRADDGQVLSQRLAMPVVGPFAVPVIITVEGGIQ